METGRWNRLTTSLAVLATTLGATACSESETVKVYAPPSAEQVNQGDGIINKVTLRFDRDEIDQASLVDCNGTMMSKPETTPGGGISVSCESVLNNLTVVVREP